MKDVWKILIKMALPLLRAAGEAKKEEDANTTGQDDAAGASLIFAADLLDALVAGNKALPKAPEVLR